MTEPGGDLVQEKSGLFLSRRGLMARGGVKGARGGGGGGERGWPLEQEEEGRVEVGEVETEKDVMAWMTAMWRFCRMS